MSMPASWSAGIARRSPRRTGHMLPRSVLRYVRAKREVIDEHTWLGHRSETADWQHALALLLRHDVVASWTARGRLLAGLHGFD
jgi:hypothetical protein